MQCVGHLGSGEDIAADVNIVSVCVWQRFSVQVKITSSFINWARSILKVVTNLCRRSNIIFIFIFNVYLIPLFCVSIIQSKVTILYSPVYVLYCMFSVWGLVSSSASQFSPQHTHRHPHMFCFPYSYLVITNSIIKVHKVIYETIKVQISS